MNWRYPLYFIAVTVSVAIFSGCVPETGDFSDCIPPEGKYDVSILRDTWGVPHIYGKTDVDTAYGLGWVHCEDDFRTVQEGLFLARGRLSLVQRFGAIPFDYMVQAFRYREMVEEKYATDLAPEVQAICDAYADAFNHYAALHPDDLLRGLQPATGIDVVLGFVMKSPMFFGFGGEMQKLMGPERAREVSEKVASRYPNIMTRNTETGSNTMAVAPSRTADGSTFLAVNSHQPWTGPVAWYEARLKSEEGLDITGGTFPGAPVVLHGHNRNLGWAHTVNVPDLADIYVLEMNPENPNQYRFDGEWRDLEVDTITLRIRLWGNLCARIPRKVYYSVHGPVIKRPHGVYAIRYAGYGDIRQVEQWYRMGKAANIDEFEGAMRMQAIPSFNVGYGDREGNIWYIYNAKFPDRPAGWDWQEYLPGDTSETLWTEYLPFDAVPQVRNPASGFIQNCNSNPFETTLGGDNPDPADFPPARFGIETRMTNRALRALELFGGDESITKEEFYTYKFDRRYSEKSIAAELREKILNELETDDPVVLEAKEALRNWDGATEPDRRGAAVAILSMEPVVRAMLKDNTPPDLMKLFVEKAHLLKDTFGRVDPQWEEVNRLVRGKVDVGLGGGPDILNAVYGNWKNGHLEGNAGDCYVLMVIWDPDGNVHSESLHQFGSATLDENSPHYADQVPLFVNRQMKPVWLDEAELRQHLEAEYRPGEERPAPKGPGKLEG